LAVSHPPAPYLGRNVLAKSGSLDATLDAGRVDHRM
jgi:hypothetical protein